MTEKRLIFGYWSSFLPNTPSSSNESFMHTRTILYSIIKDSSPKVSELWKEIFYFYVFHIKWLLNFEALFWQCYLRLTLTKLHEGVLKLSSRFNWMSANGLFLVLQHFGHLLLQIFILWSTSDHMIATREIRVRLIKIIKFWNEPKFRSAKDCFARGNLLYKKLSQRYFDSIGYGLI